MDFGERENPLSIASCLEKVDKSLRKEMLLFHTFFEQKSTND
jgi:hypothetical protein